VETSILDEPLALKLRSQIALENREDLAYSVFWRKHLRDFDQLKPLEWSGLGGGAFLGLTPRRFGPMVRARLEIGLSSLLSRAPRLSRASEPKMLTDALCRAQDRAYDYDVWRHTHVLRTLEEHDALSGSRICVIGDGLGTMSGLLALRNLKSSQQIFVVNLPEMLLLDYSMLRRMGLEQSLFFLVESKLSIAATLGSSSVRFILVSAANAEVLRDCNIDLFINIDSMQEMTHAAIDQYFSIIESNSAAFYCCNMVRRQLRDGTINEFSKFPWKSSRYRLDGEPPWLRRFIHFRWPWGRFRAPVGIFCTPHLHRLTYGPSRKEPAFEQ